MTVLEASMEHPSGARFYRCALQVNSFDYLKRNNKQASFQSEDDYNEAIIETCREIGIEVIGVTDHYRESKSLVQAARDGDLIAFNGFEAVAKDGVHFLCLFDQEKDDMLREFIGACGIYDKDRTSPTGDLDSMELLDKSKEWGATCIAAHVASEGGLLKKLSGQTRINVWKSPNLLACALPGSVSNAPKEFIRILKDEEAEYKQACPPTIIDASDASNPEDLKKDSASCFIKMSDVSIESFRQAFLDPKSRIRLHSDP